MAGDAGPQAKEALLTMVGDCDMRVEGLVKLLVAKGVITEAEWDEVLRARFTGPRTKPAAFWAAQLVNPEDRDALDDFFGAP
jgi:hypothetical protein